MKLTNPTERDRQTNGKYDSAEKNLIKIKDQNMLSKVIRQSSRLFSNLSKNYICDASIVEAYQTNQQFKSIVDEQHHKFYYQNDQQIKSQPPSVFQAISSGSSLPDNHQHLTK